jgi:hypothetical protein
MYSRIAILLINKGYSVSGLKETETLKGIAAQWRIKHSGQVVASCYDAGDGGSLSIYWQDRSHEPCLREAGLLVDDTEPVDTALLALSFYQATSAAS